METRSGNNTVIKATTREHGAKIVEYYRNLGWDTYGMEGLDSEDKGSKFIYYGVINGCFSNYSFLDISFYNVKIIELPAEPKPLEYPKVMEVSDDGECWCQRVVFMEKCGKYIAWANATNLKDAENTLDATSWDLAREIALKVEVTKQQIAEAFGTTVDRLIIKED